MTNAIFSEVDILEKLFEQHFHSRPDRVLPLQGELGGSGRSIVRLSNEHASAIGVFYSGRDENRAFLEFSKHFRRHGLPVPAIYGEAPRGDAYLEEDLGDTTLFEFLNKNRTGDQIHPDAVQVYLKVAALLPRFQVEAGRDLNYDVCYPRDSFDRQSITWDLNYFKYYYLRLAGVPFNEQLLENDFDKLIHFLLNTERDYFLYRDFQSRNIMLRDDGPFFIDYQGGRKGALQYDIASLLYDAKADLPPVLRQQLLDHYLDSLENIAHIKRDAFMHHFYAYVYVRIMQAMGAYGFRGYYERKSHFLQSVPYALKNLHWLLENVELPIALPALTDAFKSMVDVDISHPEPGGEVGGQSVSTLTIKVFSFSYRASLPTDDTANGGGFVFDCRAIPNPGREERFKNQTGQDPEVIAYLNRAEAHQFLSHVQSLVNASIANYQSRGFTDLMVSFGCTGGQHRSVYFAEQLAHRLRRKPGVQVVLRHLGLESRGK